MTTSWRVDDPAWVRSRKGQWPAVQVDLERGWVRGAKDMKRLKDYFLRGDIDQDYIFRAPEYGGPVPFVFRVWLHPERTQETFDALLASASAVSLTYSEYYVGALAMLPSPSFDDVAPSFYELFYLHPEREVRAPDENRIVPIPIRTTFLPGTIWAHFMVWMIQPEPSRNPICRFLLPRIEQATDQECIGHLKAYNTNEVKVFVANMRHVLETPSDPRFETARTLVEMLRAGKLPRAIEVWFAKHGLSA